jgi:hypothetical protein
MSGRRLIAATCAVLMVSAPGPTDAAQASSGYRFWNYFHGHDGGWQFAQAGAASFIPADGSVEGWRYGISDGVHGRQPRTNPDFDAVCAGNPSEEGTKRVAVVIDFGVREEAPEGQEPPQPIGACAVVPTGFNGQQVLEAVAQVRTDAMVCGINGYPAAGCAVPTRNANIQREPTVQLRIVSADAGSSASRSGPSGELIALVVLIVAIGLAGVMLMRRRA